jgi:hypothetical protein
VRPQSQLGKLDLDVMTPVLWQSALVVWLSQQPRVHLSVRHIVVDPTLNVYGDVVPNEMEQASAKVAGFALSHPAQLIAEVIAGSGNLLKEWLLR